MEENYALSANFITEKIPVKRARFASARIRGRELCSTGATGGQSVNAWWAYLVLIGIGVVLMMWFAFRGF